MLLKSDTVVDNEGFATSLFGLCLEYFDTFFLLISTGDLSQDDPTVHPLCFINSDTKDHCPRIIGLCSKSVTQHSSYISV